MARSWIKEDLDDRIIAAYNNMKDEDLIKLT
jgi:hypothetical protein